jgi:dTDP-4-dehydrorhamnose 3,5-epimerase
LLLTSEKPPLFGKYVAVKLTSKNNSQLFIPKGFAHGFVVLIKEALFAYKIDN